MSKSKQNDAFIKAVHAMEKRTSNVSACVVIDPTNPERTGRVVISYPRDGAGRLYVIAWLPGTLDEGSIRHCGWASGGGYDKATAAMGGAEFVAPNGERGKLVDQGFDWASQLRTAGFIVVTAV